MVSFWPWKGDDGSPASFERVLSSLSVKISKTSSKLDSLRQRSRRFNLLWTLYAGFAYLLYTIILVLIVGWRNWGLVEWAAVAGGPLIIYLVRLGLATYYDYRTSNVQAHMDELQRQRDATIKNLKAATKYDSTQELLKKYGGTPTPKAKPAGNSDRKVTSKQDGAIKVSRMPFIPPPTANIPGRNVPPPIHPSPQTSTPQSVSPRGQQDNMPSAGSPRSPNAQIAPSSPIEEFAPNAFSVPPQYAQVNEGSRWYDRIMDVLLGEDETRPGARMALICNRCRLVNGQAPPGVKRLEDLGKWRCGGCGTVNGEESELKRIVSSMRNASKETDLGRKDEERGEDISTTHHADRNTPSPASEGHKSDVTQYSTEQLEKEEESRCAAHTPGDRTLATAEIDGPRRRSTRSTKGKKPR